MEFGELAYMLEPHKDDPVKRQLIHRYKSFIQQYLKDFKGGRLTGKKRGRPRVNTMADQAGFNPWEDDATFTSKKRIKGARKLFFDYKYCGEDPDIDSNGEEVKEGQRVNFKVDQLDSAAWKVKSSKANLSDVKQHEYLNRVADLRKKNLHCRLLNGRMKTQLREQRDFINDKNKEIEELKKQLATSNRQYSQLDYQMKRTATLLNEEKDKTLDEMQHTKVLKETLKGYERYQANVLEMNYSYRFRYPWMPCTASHDNYGDSNVLRATELTSPVRAFYRAAGYLEILLGDRQSNPQHIYDTAAFMFKIARKAVMYRYEYQGNSSLSIYNDPLLQAFSWPKGISEQVSNHRASTANTDRVLRKLHAVMPWLTTPVRAGTGSGDLIKFANNSQRPGDISRYFNTCLAPEPEIARFASLEGPLARDEFRNYDPEDDVFQCPNARFVTTIHTVTAEEEVKPCIICLSDMTQGNEVVITPCNHLMCQFCATRQFRYNYKCPMCRQGLYCESEACMLCNARKVQGQEGQAQEQLRARESLAANLIVIEDDDEEQPDVMNEDIMNEGEMNE